MERSQSHPESPQHRDGEWNVRTIKEYFERVITDRDAALKLTIEDRDRALQIAVTELDRRLANLNNAHAAAKEKERDFYSRDQHEAYASSIRQQLDQLRSETEALRRPQWQLWFPALALLFTVISGVWYFATQPLQLELSHQKDRDTALDESIKNAEKANDAKNKLTNDRIDRLYELYRDLQTQHSEALKAQKEPRR